MIILEKAKELEIKEKEIYELEDDEQHSTMQDLKRFILDEVEDLLSEINSLSGSINVFVIMFFL
jgi:hypothetical protein